MTRKNRMRNKIKTTVSKIFLSMALLATPQYSNAFDFEIDFEDLTGLEDSIGQFDSFLDGILTFDINDLMGDVGADNEVMSCLLDGANLGSLLQGTSLGDGICGLLDKDLGIDNILSNPMAKCFDFGINDYLDNTMGMFSSLCDSSSASVDEDSEMDEATESGEEGGWSTGDTSTSGIGNYRDLTSESLMVAESSELGGVNGGINIDGETKKLEERTFPNKLTMKEVYKDEGGLIYKKAKENPNGSEANAIKKNRVEVLILKDIASKVKPAGNLDSSNIHLPKTPFKVKESIDESANFASLNIFDLQSLQSFLIKSARAKYMTIKKETLSEYYKEEKKMYFEMIAKDESVTKKILQDKKVAFEALSAKYTLELKRAWEREDYMPDVSRNIENITKPEFRDVIKVRALKQINRETIIKTKLAEAKRALNFSIEQVLEQSYYLSSIYRKDIAKKEIDALLKAVDKTIQ